MIYLDFYSPLEEIRHPLFKEKRITVYLKRDDLIHPLISGNKWRKLKYLLLRAEELGKKHLVTFGGAWSNHLLATACAGAKFGFKTTGIVRGEEVQNDVLFFCRLFGMQLHFVSRERYRNRESLFKELFNNEQDSFFIDEGGASPEAAKGCSEIVAELPPDIDHIFSACGTGTTAAGIINGMAVSHLSTRFHGIPVLKNGEFLREEIRRYTREKHFELHTEYDFGGYAKTTPQLIHFIKEFSAATGILIDPVYTGKMMFALFDLIGKDYFKTEEKIVAVHTGGLFGLLGMKEKFLTSL